MTAIGLQVLGPFEIRGGFRQLARPTKPDRNATPAGSWEGLTPCRSLRPLGAQSRGALWANRSSLAAASSLARVGDDPGGVAQDQEVLAAFAGTFSQGRVVEREFIGEHDFVLHLHSWTPCSRALEAVTPASTALWKIELSVHRLKHGGVRMSCGRQWSEPVNRARCRQSTPIWFGQHQ